MRHFNHGKNTESKNNLINEKHYSYYSIYFVRYNHRKTVWKLSLHYHELMENIEEQNGKKYLETNNMLKRVLDKIKMMIGIEKFNNSKILIYTEKKLAYQVILKSWW